MNEEQIAELARKVEVECLAVPGTSFHTVAQIAIEETIALLADGGKGEAVSVPRVIELLHKAQCTIPPLGTDVWTVTPIQVMWVIGTLLKGAPQAECAPICEHEWEAMTEPHKECTKCGEVRLAECAPREARGYITKDAVERSKRVMAAVDTYHERPDGGNRHELRSILMDEFEELLAAPTPERADADTADYKRMFEEAVSALAAIDKALGIDPDEAGGAAPILEAIERLRDDGECRSCVDDKCVTGPECVTLGRDAAGASERADADTSGAKMTNAQIDEIGVKAGLMERVGKKQVALAAELSATEMRAAIRTLLATPASQERADAGKDVALLEALRKIAAIENKMYGGDWDEIEEARSIASIAILAANKETPERADLSPEARAFYARHETRMGRCGPVAPERADAAPTPSDKQGVLPGGNGYPDAMVIKSDPCACCGGCGCFACLKNNRASQERAEPRVLTEGDIAVIYRSVTGFDPYAEEADVIGFGRAIEQAVKERK